METWQEIITAGNRCFADRAYDEAETHYRSAIEAADTLFAGWFDSKKAIAAYIVSHHNLAHLYIKHDRLSEAENLLMTLQAKLKEELARHPDAGQRNEALHQALLTNAMAIKNNFPKVPQPETFTPASD